MVERLIKTTQDEKGVINTAFIERLNATFRLRLNNLVRRTRTLARRPETLVAGMYIVGCFYNFCNFHHSLRLKLSVGNYGHHWVQRTPAIAAKLTDHQWTPTELFVFKVPLPRWKPPLQRGRPSFAMRQLAQRWARRPRLNAVPPPYLGAFCLENQYRLIVNTGKSENRYRLPKSSY
jgi:hypothetical protein